MASIKRNEDGTLKKGTGSLNAAGRPTGKKSQVSYDKMLSKYNKFGDEALEEIMDISRQLKAKGDLLQSLKGFVFVADVKYKLTLHDHKLYIERLKAEKADADIDDEENVTDDYTEAVTFVATHTG